MIEEKALGKVSASQMAEEITRQFPEEVINTGINENVAYVTINPESILNVISFLILHGARFVVSVGTDYMPKTGKLEINHLFSWDSDQTTIVIKALVDPAEAVSSIASILPAASWAERECRDLVGINFKGLPDPRRLALADDWPKDVHPLRRDFPYNYRPPPAPENAVPMNMPKSPASVVPLGPFYPVLEEPVYFRVFVEGEQIVDCDYRGFYNHRGIEKLGDSALTYNQVAFLAERI